MNIWERCNETSLPDKKNYSSLKMEAITDAEQRHAERVWKDFKLENLGQYYDLHLQNDMPKIYMNEKCLKNYL